MTRGVHELYDIAADPLEKQEVSASQPEVLANLRAELDAWIAEQEAFANDLPRFQQGSDRTNRLRALGYI